jgi:hypothetical protein
LGREVSLVFAQSKRSDQLLYPPASTGASHSVVVSVSVCALRGASSSHRICSGLPSTSTRRRSRLGNQGREQSNIVGSRQLQPVPQISDLPGPPAAGASQPHPPDRTEEHSVSRPRRTDAHPKVARGPPRTDAMWQAGTNR